MALAPATLSLAEAIRRGEHLDAHPPLVTTAVKHINLPDHSLPLIGREEDLALIAGRLTNPDCRLITLTGPGGIGKTRLAIEAARRALATFVNGVCFIPLAGVRAPEFILSAVAQSFGLGSLLGGDVESYMLAYLREKRILVVLDSFEHLLEGSQHVIRLLRHAPGIKVLVTSRERLHLSEEWLLPLSGLPVEGAAMNLFQQRATRADPSFDATRQHAAIYDICDLVEGLPLALELAAAWVDTLSCERIAQEIRLNASFLSAVRRDAPDRHQGTRHLIDHSWNLLSPTLRSVFMRLSVFRSGFGIREGQFVADASLGQLKTLVEKSLLRSSRDRFDLHELIRQYAADRLSEAGEADTTARRHFAAYLNLADEARLHLLGRDQLHWMARLERESDNFRAALGWAFASHHEAGRIAQLVSSLAWYWRFTNKLEEAKGWLERALNLDGLTSADQAALLCHMGHNAWMRSDFYAAERYFKASLEDCYDFGGAGRHDAAYAQTGLAMTRYFQAEYLEARVLFEASLVDFQALRDAWWTACCYGWLGKVFAMLGDRDAAKQVNEECLKRFRSLGNPLGLGLFLPSAARLQLERGNIVEARQLTEEARVLLEQLDFRHPLGAIYHLLGVIERLEGRRAEADRHFRKGVTLYREMGQVVLAQDLLREVEDQSTWLN